MMKVGTLYREKIISILQDNSETAEGLFFIGFNELSADQLNLLRKNLRAKSAKMFVAKNKLIQKSYKDLELNELLAGQTAVVYTSADVVEVAKGLCDFRKENKALVIKGGAINDNVLSADDIVALSMLPSREVLLGMTVNVIASPLTSLVTSMQQIITKLPWALNAIKDKKENQ